MLMLPGSVQVYLAAAPTDMRRGFDSLGRMVLELGMDAYSGHLFAFVSRRGDRIKILCWDRGGFVLWYKRLESGRFKIPAAPPGADRVQLDGPALSMLLDGIDTGRVERPAAWMPKNRQGDRHEPAGVIKTSDVGPRGRAAQDCHHAASERGTPQGRERRAAAHGEAATRIAGAA